MKRIRRIWKAVLVFFAAAMIPLALMGCGKNDEQPPAEQPSTEHPSKSEHPSKEDSSKEQPSKEHPSGEHPN